MDGRFRVRLEKLFRIVCGVILDLGRLRGIDRSLGRGGDFGW